VVFTNPDLAPNDNLWGIIKSKVKRMASKTIKENKISIQMPGNLFQYLLAKN
jgi:hypothetical protein